MNTGRYESHIAIDPVKLMAEMNRRAMSAAGLSAEAGIAPGTLVSLLHHGKPVTVRTARAIALALTKHPVNPELEALL